MTAIAKAIERYLRAGQYELDDSDWPGQNICERGKNGHDEVLRALVTEQRLREDRATKFGNVMVFVFARVEGDTLETAQVIAEARMPEDVGRN